MSAPVPPYLVEHFGRVLGLPSTDISTDVNPYMVCLLQHRLVLLSGYYRHLIIGLCGYGTGTRDNDTNYRIIAMRMRMMVASYLSRKFIAKTPIAMHQRAMMLLSCGRCIEARDILQMNLGLYRQSAIIFVEIHLFGRDGIKKNNDLCEKVLETLSDDADVDGLRAILCIAQNKTSEPVDLDKTALLLDKSRNGGSIYGDLALLRMVPFILRRFRKFGLVLSTQELETMTREVVNKHGHPYTQLKLATLLKRKYKSYWYYNDTQGVPQEVVDEVNALTEAAAKQGFKETW